MTLKSIWKVYSFLREQEQLFGLCNAHAMHMQVRSREVGLYNDAQIYIKGLFFPLRTRAALWPLHGFVMHLRTMVQNSLKVGYKISRYIMSSGASERTSERMSERSGASERASGCVNGQVLTSRFLAFLNHRVSVWNPPILLGESFWRRWFF